MVLLTYYLLPVNNYFMGGQPSQPSKPVLHDKPYDSKLLQVFQRQEEKNYNSLIKDVKKFGKRPKDDRAQLSSVSVQLAPLRSASKRPDYLIDIIQPQARPEDIRTLKSSNPLNVENEKVWSYPYCTIGVVVSNSSYIGTGCIIGPQLILTCGHNCFDIFETNQQYNSISFTPSVDYLQMSEKYKAKRVYYHKKFKQSDWKKYKNRTNDYVYLYDFSIIQLDTTQNLEEIYGSLGYDFDWLPSQIELPLYIENGFLVGYPVQSKPIKLTEVSGDFIVDDKVIIHRMKTQMGNSGSPIMVIVNGQYFIRGIHNAKINDPEIQQATAVLLNKQMFQRVQEALSATINYSFNFNRWKKQLQRQGLRQFINYVASERQECLNQLIRIELYSNQVGVEGCRLLKNAAWKNLQYIDLGSNGIGPEGCCLLKEAHWPALQTLGLSSNPIKPEGCRYLKEAHWPALRALYLLNSQIGSEGCQHLKEAHWPILKTLGIYKNQIRAEGCRHLRETNWPLLQVLGLSCNQIGDEGCKYLKEAHWPALQILYLIENQIGAAGCRQLNKAHWPVLQTLSLRNNKIPEAERVHLREKDWEILWQ